MQICDIWKFVKAQFVPRANMRKPLTIIIISAVVMSVGCDRKSKPLNEREIAKVIPNEISDGMNVVGVEVDKRQINEKEDIVFAIINLENDIVHRTTHYKLLFNFYDKGGWTLDNYEIYKPAVYYPLVPPPESEILKTFKNEYPEYSLQHSDTDNIRDGNASYTYTVKKDGRFASTSGQIRVDCRFAPDKGAWSYSTQQNTTTDWKTTLIGTWETEWEVYSPMGGRYLVQMGFSINDVSNSSISVIGKLSSPGYHTVEFNMSVPASKMNPLIKFSTAKLRDDTYFVTIGHNEILATRGAIYASPLRRTGN